jgi:hypothetical protein
MMEELKKELEKLTNDQQLNQLLECLDELEKSNLPNDESILLSSKSIPGTNFLWKIFVKIELISEKLLKDVEYKRLAERVLDRSGFHFAPAVPTRNIYDSKLFTSKGFFIL